MLTDKYGFAVRFADLLYPMERYRLAPPEQQTTLMGINENL
jgi:hypothetical protein